MKTGQPKASFMEHAMPRKAIVGLLLLISLVLATGIAVVPAKAQTGGFCSRFDGTPPAMDGWGPCPWAPNITVSTSNISSIGGPSDFYLHLRDLSGASAACSMDAKYIGDWNKKMGGCGQFCFDFKVFQSGTPPGPITPSFTIWSGTTLSATFVANFTVTSSDPWRQHICAPINLIHPGQNLPVSPSGEWRISPTSNAYSANWNTIIQAVTAVQLPIDWTSDPSEEAGYDNICMSPGGCGLTSGLLKICKAAGPGVTVGTPFTFAAGSSTITVLAGPAPGGTCVDGPSLPVGSNVTVTETIPAGDAVSSITVAPSTQLVSTNLVTGTANVTIGGDGTVVTYTNINQTPVVTGCLKDTKVTVKCNPDGTYTLTLSGTGFTGTDITLTSQTAGVTVVPPQQPWSATTSWTLAGATSGQTVTLTANETKLGGGTVPGTDSCCSGEIKITLPDCPKPLPIDLAIAKTGSEIQGPAGATVSYTLTVTNVAAAFNGQNVIQVTDIAPAGMTFNAATGANWNCATLPVAAGGTLTCTYTGGGSIATNAVLGAITITATPTGAGRFENCASVGVTAASGLLDSNPANNKSCFTVATPQICPSPMVPGAAVGTCVCPTGTIQVGGECVQPIVCRPPLVSNATGNACVCPEGTVRRGQECVRPVQCRSPLVPNAAGQCACPAGTVLRGQECVRTVQCRSPLVPNEAGQCACPAGTVLKGQECVRQVACRSPLVPNAAGQCACPAGTVLKGQECVRTVQCEQPMIPNAAGTACVCPSGTILNGRECVAADRGSPQQPPGIGPAAPFYNGPARQGGRPATAR
jgi:uncharacterized repeat protein (TIGR01451 family)